MADNLTVDDGKVTLREAVIAANTGGATDLGDIATGSHDAITFMPEVRGSLALSLGQIDVTQSLTISGNSFANVTIDAKNRSRIFNIQSERAQKLILHWTS